MTSRTAPPPQGRSLRRAVEEADLEKKLPGSTSL